MLAELQINIEKETIRQFDKMGKFNTGTKWDKYINVVLLRYAKNVNNIAFWFNWMRLLSSHHSCIFSLCIFFFPGWLHTDMNDEKYVCERNKCHRPFTMPKYAFEWAKNKFIHVSGFCWTGVQSITRTSERERERVCRTPSCWI